MDAAEFKQLFLPYHRQLYRMAYLLMGNEQDAEDMVQNCYMRLWDNRDKLNDLRNPAAFCMTTLKNVCFDQLRKARIDVTDDPPEEYPVASEENLEKAVEIHDETTTILNLIDKLPPPQRQVITYRDVADMQFDEIENATGLSPGNIRTLLSRARKIIREQYTQLLNYERKENR